MEARKVSELSGVRDADTSNDARDLFSPFPGRAEARWCVSVLVDGCGFCVWV